MQQHANILAEDRPSTPPTLGSKVKFLEHCRVADQIKGNHKCRNVVANILPSDPTP